MIGVFERAERVREATYGSFQTMLELLELLEKMVEKMEAKSINLLTIPIYSIVPRGKCVCVCDCVRDCDMLPKPGRPCLMCISPHQPRHGTSSKLCTDGDTNDKRAPCFGGFLPLQYRTGSIMLYLICPLLQRVVVALRVEGPGHGISN